MDKITGLATMFSPENMASSKTLSVEACNGICMILEDCARDLDQIGRQNERKSAELSVLKDQVPKFESYLANTAAWIEQAQDISDLRGLAVNLRNSLNR